MPKTLKSFKDKKKAKKYRDKQRARNYKNNDFSGGLRHSWSNLEEELVLAHTVPDKILAKILRTSTRAIQLKRYRLKQ